jgi:MFS family permease
MANTLPAPATILAPIIGGWIADRAGYNTMFVLSAISGFVMAAALWLVLRDPTHRTEAKVATATL